MKFFGLTSIVLSATLTFQMKAADKPCFYTESKKVGEKVGFYFAVREGGSFDVDYEVHDPNAKLVMSGMAEREGDYAFVAQVIGEYSFCFMNMMSTFVDKSIDFDISIEHELKSGPVKSELQTAVGKTKATEGETATKQKLETLYLLVRDGVERNIGDLEHIQGTIRRNEHRNQSVIKSTESRIVWFAVVECIALFGMGALQVYAIQTFFAKSVRTRV